VIRPFFAAGVLALMLVGCASQPETEKADEPTAVQAASLFESDIAPLFRTRCATCHLTGQEAGKMTLTPNGAIASLVNVKSTEATSLMRAVPGKPDESYLIMKLEGSHIEHGGNGAQMPFGAPSLSKEEIAKIRKWIAEGAKA
jgi:mono/diheme cytochrome c family protein